ncbi:30S ribosomal protein S18 [symbiont of Argiope bruennichi]|uniref:30S ribosomal protein S18 n=1 Tax=symbiont of Argiope bruennichi TaxID=2810479 RepID=UPI003DA54370
MKPRKKKKIIKKKRNRCFFTINKIEYIDYKDIELLKKFISANGKILSQKITNNSASSQRKLTTAIKRARQVALIPYIVR